MRVAIIDSAGIILARGEWDGKRIDREYARVNGDLYHLGYAYKDEQADMIALELRKADETIKEAQKAHLRLYNTLRNEYGVR